MRNTLFFRLVIPAFALILIFSSCREKKNERLDAKTFSTKISEPGVQLLDVRAPEKFKEVHLNGAINIDWNGTGFHDAITKQLDKKKPVAVYCLDGKSSTEAADFLRTNGFEDVVVLDSGLFAWKKHSLPVVDLTPVPVGDTTKPVAPVVDVTNLAATPENFAALVQGDKPVFVDFNATWCGPCRMIKPMVERVAEARKDKLVFISVDTDKYQNLAIQYNITALPTLMLIRKGKVVWQYVGALDQSTLESGLDKH